MHSAHTNYKMDAKLTDLCGLVVTCKSQKAIDLYNNVLEAFASQAAGFFRSLKRALKLDPDFILARCMMVRTINTLHM